MTSKCNEERKIQTTLVEPADPGKFIQDFFEHSLEYAFEHNQCKLHLTDTVSGVEDYRSKK